MDNSAASYAPSGSVAPVEGCWPLSNSHSTPLLRVGVLGLISSLAILGLEVGGAAAAPSVPTPASPGAIAPAGNVIVLLRDQHTDLTITRSTTSARVEANRRSDRKSTRLNSSHVEISYAVFCLKKKKKKA